MADSSSAQINENIIEAKKQESALKYIQDFQLQSSGLNPINQVSGNSWITTTGTSSHTFQPYIPQIPPLPTITAEEFVSWLGGFLEGAEIDDVPSQEQWERIKQKMRQVSTE